ncbi:hypothetical protein WJX75_006913 [Coccomyxa subellipsoidea]|uniref:CR-type domain-containing protein n=1 Tax=Coccomyxa subellipsoidea TaxID=248742 RepID=A0ABR2YCH8_9CHLO
MQGKTGAGGLVSIGDPGGDRDGSSFQSRDALRNGSVGKSKDSVRTAAVKPRWPFDRGNSTNGSHKDEGLPASLFAPYKDLPGDGRTLTEREETCDPMERNCQVPMHVWESKCRACHGSGTVTSYGRRGKRSSGSCPSCTGMGYVRRTSSRLIPDLNGDGKHMTIGRQLSDEDFEDFVDSRRNGKH